MRVFIPITNRRGFLLPDPSLVIIIGGIVYLTALFWGIVYSMSSCDYSFCGRGVGGEF